MLKRIFIVGILFSTMFCNAQISNIVGVRQNAIGNSGLNLNDVWAAKNNPGTFAFIEESQAGIFYQNRYLVSELMTQGLAYGHKTQKGNVGVYIQHAGFEMFRTMEIGAAYALALSPRFGMGVSFNYQQTRFGDIYGVKHHFIGNLGVNYKLSESISIAACVHNIARSKVSDFENERLPTLFGIGVLYQISPKVLWLLDAEKEISSQLNIKTGLEIKAHEFFDVRLGINTYPFQSSFGFGVHVKKLEIDIAAIWHAQIGLTPSLGLVYNFE